MVLERQYSLRHIVLALSHQDHPAANLAQSPSAKISPIVDLLLVGLLTLIASWQLIGLWEFIKLRRTVCALLAQHDRDLRKEVERINANIAELIMLTRLLTKLPR